MTNTQSKLRRWQLFGLLAMLVGGAGCGLGFSSAEAAFSRGYLVGFLFWWQITVGFVGLALLRCIVRSNWGNATWPYLKASLATAILMAAAYLPVFLLRRSIFPWAREDAVEEGTINPFQADYFADSFFTGRSIGYFAIWMVCGLIAARTGDSSGEARWPRRFASLALAALVLSASFAAIDWGMSLEPQWYSTIYGAMVLLSGVVAAMAALILSLALVFRMPRLKEVRVSQVVNDLGNLQLAFVMIWAYLAFSQYLIIWSGNLPSEVTWYVRRAASSWQVVMLAVVASHFVVPFALLLSREQKRRPRRLAWVAGLLLAGSLIQTVWTYAPSFTEQVSDLHWSLVPAIVAIGGGWLLVYSFALNRTLAAEELTGGEQS